MCTAAAPGSTAEAVRVLHAGLAMVRSAAGFLAASGAADLPAEVLAEGLRELERADAAGAAVRGVLLAAFGAQNGQVADGQRTVRTWLLHVTRVTRGQAAEHRAMQKLADDHRVLLAALADGDVLTKSEALQVARWIRAIPADYRDEAEKLVVDAARAGADLRGLAAICAEIRYQTAPPDPDDQNDKHLDRGLEFGTTFEGAGVIRGDLTPECAAMVQAVLDALSAPQGGQDVRTRPQRYHDALEEAARRLLASDLLPKRAGQPVKALVHISFADLCQLDADSGLQDAWIAGYRARWAAHRGAASVSTGDGGAWLEGDKARAITCDAMIIPVVIGDLDPGAIEDLIALCVRYHQIRTQGRADPQDSTGTQDAAPGPAAQDGTSTQDSAGTPATQAVTDGTAAAGTAAATSDGTPVPAGLIGSAARHAEQAAAVAEVVAGLEQQIIGKVLQVVSGPGGVASFLRRSLLGKGLNGPSLPLDVGQTDDIPVHLRRLVALRDQTCQYPGGCDQPAAGCEAHHVVHRADGGHTSLTNLKDYCWWHHHVVLHQLGWVLTANADGTSQVTSPAGKTIRSHSPPPPPRPG
jgi:Domain of unknown function (DUF222)